MASAAVALREALLVVAVCVVLFHSSVGQQPPPSPAPYYTGQQPSPPPPPPPLPAPAPTNCNYSVCSSQCTPYCQARYNATAMNCTSMLEGAFNGCYGACTNRTCPGNCCVHSGCGYGDCSCGNPHARSCCEECREATAPSKIPGYQQCQNYDERFMGYCLQGCQNQCSKNCTQGA